MVRIIEDSIDLPEELVQPIKALTDEARRKIILSLLGKGAISYSEMQNAFHIKKGTLNHHLHILVSAGLVRNFSDRIPGNPYSSYYSVTSFGRKFMEGLRQTLEPKRVKTTVTFNGTATVQEEIVGTSASESAEVTPAKSPAPQIQLRS